MTRSSPAATYDDDFYAWTQEQAAALHAIPQANVGPDIDIDHVAEEIEDLGKRDLREVSLFLTRLIANLVKIDARPESPGRTHWISESVHFQESAFAAASQSMRQLLDVELIWKRGGKLARCVHADLNVPPACPFTLDELLADDFDLDAALGRLRDTRGGPSLDRGRARG